MPHAADDTPRTIVARPSTGDKIFRGILRASGWSVFVITGLILVFLILRAAKAFKFMGFAFLTTRSGSPRARSTSASPRSCRSASSSR